MNIEDRIKRALVNEIGCDEKALTPEANFVDDLGCDSLDAVEIVMALEEEFNIEVSDEDAERLTTVGKVLEYVRQKVGK